MTDYGAAPDDYVPPDLEPGRGHFAHRFGGQSIFAEPDPITVARLWRSHGAQAAYERWHWKTKSEMRVIRDAGRRRLEGRQ